MCIEAQVNYTTDVLIHLSADRGQLKVGKISLATETSQIIPSVTVLSVDFEFVSQSLPWSQSCHHSLVAQFCLETRNSASSEQMLTSYNFLNRILFQFQLC